MNYSIEKMLVTLENSWPGFYDRAAICDHIMQGYIAGSFARFNNPGQEVSAHFGVGLSGRIVQFVDMGRSAWANGILQDGFDVTLPWLLECKTKGINPNRRTISIEHEGFTGVKMPEAQYQATLFLHKEIIKAWPNIRPGRKTIIGHNQISPKDKPFCPGSGFPFDRLITDLQEAQQVSNSNIVPGGISVRKEFSDFWFSRGGLAIFGYPISSENPAGGLFGSAVSVQYFERARFELQPDGSVQLGLVGREAFNSRGFRRV